jgi:hypothetical protein
MILCNRCYKDLVITCNQCGKKALRKNNNFFLIEENTMVCNDCCKLYYDNCEQCGNFKRKEKIVFINQSLNDSFKKIPIKKTCKNCLEHLEIDYEYCHTCKSAIINPVENSFIYLYNEEVICKECLKKEHNKGQYFIEFPATINKIKNSYDIYYTTTAITSLNLNWIIDGTGTIREIHNG